MRVVTKKVYYCDFCKKHGLRSLKQHESRCTANPDRECHWIRSDEPHTRPGDLRPHIAWCKELPEITEETVEVLRLKLNGCPACMLAVFRISRANARQVHNNGERDYVVEGPDYHDVFHYTAEVERFNNEQAEAEYQRELDDFRATMY